MASKNGGLKAKGTREHSWIRRTTEPLSSSNANAITSSAHRFNFAFCWFRSRFLCCSADVWIFLRPQTATRAHALLSHAGNTPETPASTRRRFSV